MRHLFTAILLSMLLAVSTLFAIYAKWIEVPASWDPWAPLQIEAEPDWLTSFKLRRLSNDAGLCASVLATSGMRYTGVADNDAGNDCGWQGSVRITALPAQLSSPFTLTCKSAVALVMWERHVVQPAALQYFGQAVTRVDHFGSYACRNVRGAHAEGRRRSQHASANAIDVAGFRLRDGRRIRVAQDWSQKRTDLRVVGSAEPPGAVAMTPEAAFLRDVHRGACRFFTGSLGPDYNAAHHDHFHLDRGPFRVCR